VRLLKNAIAVLFPNKVKARFEKARLVDQDRLIKDGFALYQQSNYKEAGAIFREVLEINAENTDAICMLAQINHDIKNYPEAIEYYEQAIQKDPNIPEAYSALADIFHAIGNSNRAVEYIQKAIKLRPNRADIHNQYGAILKDRWELQLAKSEFEKAISIAPDFLQSYYNLAIVFAEMNDINSAMQLFSEIIGKDANFVLAYCGRGRCLLTQGKTTEALRDLEKARSIEPNSATVLSELSGIFLYRGQIEEAVECIHAAIKNNPNSSGFYQNLLLTLLYDPACNNDQLFNQHKKFETQFAKKVYEEYKDINYSNLKDPNRPLRIGYLSADFRDHPVGYNIKPFFEAHNHDQFKIFCYSSVRSPSKLTDWFKEKSDKWVSIVGVSDEAAAQKIKDDQIDILVSLAGRFDNNRPLICTYKPAPIQVSFYDGSGSGLKTMDYFITDIVANPRNTSERFDERLVHLPSLYVYTKPQNQIAVNDLPAAKNGFLTFCSMNNPAKINDRVVNLWSQVMHSVPRSQLLMKYKNFYADEGLQKRYLDLFAKCGIQSGRISLLAGMDSREHHLSLYNQADISLDTFPFTGANATFESLLMGVPEITLAGERMMGRWSASVLKQLKMGDWVAHSTDEFIEMAKTMSSKIDALSDLRRCLRERVINSPICDAKIKTRHLERVYRYMWRKWCATQEAE
jgi:predicted O-linked N-acetylglucosamine transferase (SPINDLY family)